MKLVMILGPAFAAAVFFWGRGIVRGRVGDMVAGFMILMVTSAILLVSAGHSGVFAPIGFLVFGFGVATLLLSPFAAQDCPLSRGARWILGASAIVAGLFLQVIV